MRNPGSRSGAPMLGAARWQSRRAAERAVRRPGDVHELLGVHGRPTHTQATERALKATRSILRGKPTQNATTSRQLQLQSDNWTRQDKWTIVNEMSREAAGAAAPAAGGAAAVAGAAAAAASGRWATGSGRWSSGSGRWATGSGRWDSSPGQKAEAPAVQNIGEGATATPCAASSARAVGQRSCASPTRCQPG